MKYRKGEMKYRGKVLCSRWKGCASAHSDAGQQHQQAQWQSRVVAKEKSRTRAEYQYAFKHASKAVVCVWGGAHFSVVHP
jgi:hypothetical protein